MFFNQLNKTLAIFPQQIHAQERDFVAACERLGEGAGYAAQAGAHYTRALFMLSKGMVSGQHELMTSNLLYFFTSKTFTTLVDLPPNRHKSLSFTQVSKDSNKFVKFTSCV